jgi:hypothetical protein
MEVSKTPPLRNIIDLSDDVLVRQWVKHFGASKEEIAAAIEKVANSAEAVGKELKTRKPDE